MGTLIITRLAAPFGMWETHSASPMERTPASLVTLFLQWGDCANRQQIPRALDFMAPALRDLAGNLALVDLRHGVDHARYLWAGPALVQLFGAPLTGRLLSQCYGGQTLHEVRDAYRRMLDMGGPVFSDRRFRVFSESLGYHRLLLPLLDEQGETSLALLALLPKGKLRNAAEWRVLELELDLANAIVKDKSR